MRGPEAVVFYATMSQVKKHLMKFNAKRSNKRGGTVKVNFTDAQGETNVANFQRFWRVQV